MPTERISTHILEKLSKRMTLALAVYKHYPVMQLTSYPNILEKFFQKKSKFLLLDIE